MNFIQMLQIIRIDLMGIEIFEAFECQFETFKFLSGVFRDSHFSNNINFYFSGIF